MASLAANWEDRGLPEVGLRQWVVPVPWLLARMPDLARGGLAVAIRTLARFLTRRAAARVGPCPVRRVTGRHSAVRGGVVDPVPGRSRADVHIYRETAVTMDETVTVSTSEPPL